MQPACAPFSIHHYHPLELVPFFRRWRSGFWRDLVYTFIWNSALALLFTALALLWVARTDLPRLLWLNFVYAQSVGYAIHALYLVGYLVVPRERLDAGGVRFVFLGVIPVIGVVVGFFVGQWLLGAPTVPSWLATPRGLAALVLNALLIAGILMAVMLPRERAAKATARVAAAEREAALAQLKALEAQVEPHFLYNTLAHVASLIDDDPGQARRMLERLIAWLRSTTRAGAVDGTLAGQAELTRAYLDILALRMGRRLAWTIDVPDTLARAALPPSLLQPLVENAIKHGLEPTVDGGTIDIRAREAGGDLEITVSDTGGGFTGTTAPIGGSTQRGLALLKQRLAALYGDRASLTLAENRPRGVRATLRLPLQPAHAPAASPQPA
jgi:signal transduction histidine kinase